MIKIFYLPLLLIFPITLMAQIEWQQKENFPGAARTAAVSFTIDDNSYVGLGKTESQLATDFYEYNHKSNSWSKIADFPGEGREDAVAFSVNGKGYVATGYGSFGYLKDVWEYDPGTNQWIQKKNFPGEARTGAVAFSINTQSFIATGKSSSNYLADCWAYFSDTDTWVQKASMSADNKRSEAFSFTHQGKGYIGGGFSFENYTTTIHNSLYVYDPVLNTWSEKVFADISLGRQNTVAFVVNDRVFFGLGFGKRDIYEYVPSTNQFKKETNFGPSSKDNRYDAVAMSTGSSAVVGLGTYSADLFSSSMQNDIWQATFPSINGPYNPRMVSISNDKTEIAWSDEAEEANGYNIEIAKGSDKVFTKYGSTSAKSYSFDNFMFDQKELSTFLFRVISQSTGLISDTLVINYPVYAPEGLSVVPLDFTTNKIIWRNESTKATHLTLERSTDNVSFTPIATIQTPASEYTDNNLVTDRKYFYKIKSHTASSTSSYSLVRQATPMENLGYWIDLPGVLPINRNINICESANGKVYFGIGENYNKWHEYDPATQSTVEKTVFPGVIVDDRYIRSFVLNSKVYVLNQIINTYDKAELYQYDPSSDSWKKLNDVANFYFTISECNGKAYGLSYHEFDVYDPVTDSWTKRAGHPGDDVETSFTLKNKIYFGIGLGKELYSYDPQLDSWKKMSDFPGMATHDPISITLGNLGYVVGGSSGFAKYSTEVWAYDADSDSWINKMPLGEKGHSTMLNFTYQGKGYFFGGITNHSYSQEDARIFYPESLNKPENLAYQVVAAPVLKIHLTWADNTTLENSYVIERRADGGNFEQIAVLGANATQYQDINVSTNVQYEYKVKAVNATKEGFPFVRVKIDRPAIASNLNVLKKSNTINDQTFFYPFFEWYHEYDAQTFIVEIAAGVDTTQLNYEVVDTVFADEANVHFDSQKNLFKYEYSFDNYEEGEFLALRVITKGEYVNSEPSEEGNIYYFSPIENFTGIFNEEENSISLSWEDRYNTEEFFVIERKDVGNSTTFRDTLSANSVGYVDNLESIYASKRFEYTVYVGNYLVTSTGSKTILDINFISSLSENNFDCIIYPVPLQNTVKIQLPNGFINKVQLLDANGRILLTNNLERLSDCQLDVSQIKKGVYFIKIFSSEGEIVKKLVK